MVDSNTEKLLSNDINKNEETPSPLVKSTERSWGEHSWGWRGFRPKYLQFINNPKGFMVFLCIFGLVQGMAINTFVNQALPTLERRFGFNSKQAGFIPSSNDITAIILVGVVSFYGGVGNRPLWLGAGSIITALGTLIFTIPQGLVGEYIPPELKAGRFLLCQTKINVTADDSLCNLDDTVSSSGIHYFLFVLGQLIAGAGATPLHTLGPAYLDDNVHPQYIGIYFGVFYLTVFLGPGLGSILGGKLLGIWIDLNVPKGVRITPFDPRWMGAWWLGPLGSGVILVVVGLIITGYPRMLPSGVALQATKKRRAPPRVYKNLSDKLKDIIPATRSLLTNPVYICQNLALTASVFSWMGIGPFMFKIIRSRYGASPMMAGIASAIIVIGGCGLGMMLGGLIVKWRKIEESKRAAKYTFFLQLLGIWSMWCFLIPGCSNSKYAGFDVPYHNSSMVKGSDMTLGACNSACHCSTAQFRPVCGPDGVSYYSPCFAGCKASLGMRGFTNCSCVPDFVVNATTTLSSTNGIVLQNDGCIQDCKNLPLFVIGLIITAMFSLTNAVPSKITTMRCVSDDERSYSLGIQFIFMRLFGSLPGPIIVGYIIDHTCTMWKTVCGERTNCLNYNYDQLGWILVYYGVPTQVLSVLFYFLSWHFTKRDSATQTASEVKMDDIAMETKPVLSDEIHEGDKHEKNGHV
ncbi:predicted protein [Nematostella vectensis]|uniref:Solute carrier organic anion transporter family member n=1 Tax=Nematostella vectensis TaxID=45351 RepID=A7SWE4_NEMVE|nr:predicted protein [Nematostella vectensis]|eukprot:XP_001624073.1 predicted protein [Nematostella vectensis]